MFASVESQLIAVKELLPYGSNSPNSIPILPERKELNYQILGG